MMINRSEEVAGAAESFDDVLASFVGGAVMRPCWMPLPAQMFENARGQWSRPGCLVPAGALA